MEVIMKKFSGVLILLIVGTLLSCSDPASSPAKTVSSPPPAKSWVVSTLAGSTRGFADGAGTEARFNYPYGMAVDASGNLYVADYYSHRIRRITPAGEVSTFAGSGTAGSADGLGTSAQFKFPTGVAVDSSGNLYVADRDNHLIRKITAAGEVSTFAGSSAGFADGAGTAAKFNKPTGVAVDSSGNVYIGDQSNHRIRGITSGGLVSTLAGSTQGYMDGAGTSAQFRFPYGVAVDASVNVYVADYSNHLIRKITPAGEVSTFAGSGTAGSADGLGTSAQFSSPSGVAVDASDNVYVADLNNHLIRKITAAGEVSTFAGTGTAGFADGAAGTAQFKAPIAVTVDAAGNVYVADYSNHLIRKIEYKVP